MSLHWMCNPAVSGQVVKNGVPQPRHRKLIAIRVGLCCREVRQAIVFYFCLVVYEN